MVLLDILRTLKKEEKKLVLYVLHYNHKWRKKSHLDANLVRKYCKQNQIKFLYKETTGKVVKDEEIARNQRYLFFKEVAKKYNLNIICTAHHKDDQVETILFRLARGTGPHGLLPIKKIYNLTPQIVIFRPLIDVTKKQIEDYARTNKISYIEDKTNKDINYKRNLIRKKIIPLLQEINKEAGSNILLCSDLIYSQNNIVNEHFPDLLKKISIKKSFFWNRERFLSLNEYTQKAFIYWFLTLCNFKGGLSKIESIRNTIKDQGKLDLNKRYILIVTSNGISFQEKGSNWAGKNEAELNIPISLNGKSKKVPVGKELFLVLKPFNKKKITGRFPQDKDKIAYVNLSNYKNKNLTIRHRKPNDVFQPLGLSNLVKLKNYLINKKISKEIRYNLPLICFDKEVLWLPGYSLSEKIKVINKPTHILEIKR